MNFDEFKFLDIKPIFGGENDPDGNFDEDFIDDNDFPGELFGGQDDPDHDRFVLGGEDDPDHETVSSASPPELFVTEEPFVTEGYSRPIQVETDNPYFSKTPGVLGGNGDPDHYRVVPGIC